ncbi:hypothetical protein KQI65_07105 [bacterium]|nr:hypothetical protein [bacterium]
MSQAKWLGMNLVGVSIKGGDAPEDHVIPSENYWNNNAVVEVCEAANAKNLRVLVRDGELSRRFMGERIMINPESVVDYASHIGSPSYYIEEFEDHFINDGPFSKSLTDPNSSENCILISQTSQTVHGISIDRIREMSAYRVGDADVPNRTSGMYQLSLIVKYDDSFGAPLPMDNTNPILNINIQYTDPNTGIQFLTYSLTGKHFFHDTPSGRERLTGVQEIVIGEVELLQTNGRPGGELMYAQYGNSQSHLWWSWTDVESVRGTTRLREHKGDLENVRGEFDITINYGTADSRIYVDAVCLTNPATYGLWNPDNQWTLPIHSSHRSQAEERLAYLCQNNDPVLKGSGALPGLRYVVGEEQVASNGTYYTTILLSKLIKTQTGEQVELFSTYGSETITTTTPLLATEMITGPYNYPILADHPRPTLPSVAANDYLTPLYDYGDRPDGYSGMWELLYANMVARIEYASETPWVPYIQNHTNLLHDNIPDNWYDGIPNREPSAAELRMQCNLVLALGADGVLFYAFSSVPFTSVVPPTPPATPTVSASDRMLPNPSAGVNWDDPLDLNNGTMGFIGNEGNEDARRILDWNGENKWDSTQAYIETFLKPIGSFISQHLNWKNGIQWNSRWRQEAGASELVSMIVSRRQDIANSVDSQDKTYVIASEYEVKASNPPTGCTAETKYLFVINGNTYDGVLHSANDPIGQRHITIKLSTLGGTVGQWRVTNVVTGDIWIVKASETPDEMSYSNGFTEYFAPGAANLFRLDPMLSETTDMNPIAGGTCVDYDRSIYVEPEATLRLYGTDELLFSAGNGLYCDGDLIALGTTFGSCDALMPWIGIVARNGGNVSLQSVDIMNGSVIAGSGGVVDLDEICEISYVDCALWNLGGDLTSTGTISHDIKNHLIHVGSSVSRLFRDHAVGIAEWGNSAITCHSNEYRILVDECKFDGFWRGAYAWDGTILGDVDHSPPASGGNNSFSFLSEGLVALQGGWIHFGALDDTLSSTTERNEFLSIDPDAIQAMTEPYGYILAKSCWWEPSNWGATPPSPLHYSGNVSYDPLLLSDPIPFTRTNNDYALSKSVTTFIPGGTKGQIISAAAKHNHGEFAAIIS